MKLRGICFFVLILTGCGYQRVDLATAPTTLIRPTDSITVAPFANRTERLGVERQFTEALRTKIVQMTPWQLESKSEASKWILRCTIDRWDTQSLAINLGLGQERGNAGTPTRLEIIISASFELVDRASGEVVYRRSGITLSNQYRTDQNFLNFQNREELALTNVAFDMAEAFVIQLSKAERP